jgi:hypothetical protein
MENVDMPDFFKDLLRLDRTPKQVLCEHTLACKMDDGKWFCPSCSLKSDYPLGRHNAP